jgi:hypothetical protein
VTRACVYPAHSVGEPTRSVHRGTPSRARRRPSPRTAQTDERTEPEPPETGRAAGDAAAAAGAVFAAGVRERTHAPRSRRSARSRAPKHDGRRRVPLPVRVLAREPEPAVVVGVPGVDEQPLPLRRCPPTEIGRLAAGDPPTPARPKRVARSRSGPPPKSAATSSLPLDRRAELRLAPGARGERFSEVVGLEHRPGGSDAGRRPRASRPPRRAPRCTARSLRTATRLEGRRLRCCSSPLRAP